MKAIWLCVVAVMLATAGDADSLQSRLDPAQVPAFKATEQAQYLTSQEAYALLQDDPAILFVDVRDPVEIATSGWPSMVDAVAPVRVLRDGDTSPNAAAGLAANPDFLTVMEDILAAHNKSRHDMIILTCGSGRRSADAARILIRAGFTNVWHVPDGYPGDTAHGFNVQHAWRNAGLPWSDAPVTTTPWQLVLNH